MDVGELKLQPKEKRKPNEMLQRDKDWLFKTLVLSEHPDLQVDQELRDLQRIHHRILGLKTPSSREAVLLQHASLEQRGM